MIEYELGVEDLADTRFAISPLAETVFSLWTLVDPGRTAAHLPWRSTALSRLSGLDAPLLLSLVGPTLAVPDFLTPRPAGYTPTLKDELATVRATPVHIVRRDLLAAYAPAPLPDVLRAAAAADAQPVLALLETLCNLLHHYWDLALAPIWPQMRLVLEADTTYRARQLAVGGARLLFADMHPNLRWQDGVLHIDKMIGQHRAAAAGRGLLLMPSVFAYKPVPPVSASDPPSLAYPARGLGTLWTPAPAADTTSLNALLGAARARLLHLLNEPQPTVELARQLRVTPSAVSQHLQVLHATGLVTRTRDRRHVLYRRTPLADQLIRHGAPAG
jgi:DNA-binding transcriptional ArsR family regulator